MSLRTKLILLLTAFTIIPLLFFGMMVFSSARNTLKAVRTAQLNSIADLKQDRIETFFNERRADIRSVQHFYNIKLNLPVLSRLLREKSLLSPGHAYEDLDRQIKEFQKYDYLNVMLIDHDGMVVYCSDAAYAARYAGKPFPERNVYAEGKRGVYFTDVFKSASGRYEMMEAAPVKGFNGKFIGEVLLNIDMGPIYRFISDTKGLGETGEVVIARREGDAVLILSPLRSDPEAALAKRISFFEKRGFPAQKAVQGENGSGITTDYLGTEVMAAWRFLPLLRWGLVTKIDAAEAFAPVTRLRNAVIFLEVLILIVGAIAAAVIAGGVTKPVLALQRGTEIIGSGNLDYKVGTGAQDEVGQLSRLIDSMTANLKKITASRDELNAEIAERKRFEETLRRSEASLAEAQRIAHLGNWDWNIATNELTWSDEIYRIFGLTPRQFGATYDAFLNHVHPDDREFVQKEVNEALSKRKPYSIDHRIVFPDGTVRTVHEQGEVTFSEEGTPVRMIGTVQDITESKKAEEELRKYREHLEELVKKRTAALESANKELEAFSYSVSHDLRSPLRSIVGFSQALWEDHAGKLDADGLDSLKRIVSATQRMGQLIDDLLNLSRVSRADMKHGRVSLGEMAAKIAVRLQEAQPDRQAKFIIAGDLAAQGDDRLLHIVLENLLGNAWKFTGNAPRAVIEFGMTRYDGEPVYFVKDNGAGFDKAYTDKLFNPFQRLHAVNEFPGTGVGLATVKRIINRHGGRVWIEAEPEKGATVYFTLP